MRRIHECFLFAVVDIEVLAVRRKARPFGWVRSLRATARGLRLSVNSGRVSPFFTGNQIQGRIREIQRSIRLNDHIIRTVEFLPVE